MRARALVVLVVLAVAACSRGEGGAAEDLVRTARSSDELTYKVTYRYTIAGPVSDAVRTTVSVAQLPPDSVRRLETVPRDDDGEEITVASWTVRIGGVTYGCSEYEETTCRVSGGSALGLGPRDVDSAIADSRRKGGFPSVEQSSGKTIAGERASCYLATGKRQPAEPSPQVRYQPRQYRFELCYSDDGVLLRLRRTAMGEVPPGITRNDTLLEAVGVSRDVTRDDVKLPGPIQTPLPKNATPTPEP